MLYSPKPGRHQGIQVKHRIRERHKTLKEECTRSQERTKYFHVWLQWRHKLGSNHPGVSISKCSLAYTVEFFFNEEITVKKVFVNSCWNEWGHTCAAPVGFLPKKLALFTHKRELIDGCLHQRSMSFNTLHFPPSFFRLRLTVQLAQEAISFSCMSFQSFAPMPKVHTVRPLSESTE